MLSVGLFEGERNHICDRKAVVFCLPEYPDILLSFLPSASYFRVDDTEKHESVLVGLGRFFFSQS